MVPPDNRKSVLSLEFPAMGTHARHADRPIVRAKPVNVVDLVYVLDWITALTLAIITLPIVVLSLLWVVAVDMGNPFYTQIRIGLNGKPYRIYKVRSMRHDHRAHARFCADGDDRILLGGHFLRKSRIDELPQLFNVLIGEMALVGPRPEQPTFVETFLKEIPNYQDRFTVKPGITGLAQISQGYVDSTHGTQIKLKYDRFYIKKRSLRIWLYTVKGTIRVIIFRQGAR
jgi:lipopolysaccharide/colanic/teichoic acid biosynthesis glycosyltransferase